MKKVLIATFSLMLLSPAVFAAQSNLADDDDNIAPTASPKKVDMRPGQLGNLPATLAGKKIITTEQLQGAAGTVGKTGKNNTVVIVNESQPGVKVGKFLPSNKNANDNTAQIPGVPGGVVIQEGSGKKNHKNINSRSDEILGGDNF